MPPLPLPIEPLPPIEPLLGPERAEFVGADVVVHVECCDDEEVEHVEVDAVHVEEAVVVHVAVAADCTGNRGGTSPLKSNCSSFSSVVSSCCTGEDKATLRRWSSCCSCRFSSHSRCRKASKGPWGGGGFAAAALSPSTAASLLSWHSLNWCSTTPTAEGGLGGCAGARRRCWIWSRAVRSVRSRSCTKDASSSSDMSSAPGPTCAVGYMFSTAHADMLRMTRRRAKGPLLQLTAQQRIHINCVQWTY